MPVAVKALKPFDYAHDGVHIRQVSKGDEFECQPDLVDGLVRDKYVAVIVRRDAEAKAAEEKAAPEAAKAASGKA